MHATRLLVNLEAGVEPFSPQRQTWVPDGLEQGLSLPRQPRHLTALLSLPLRPQPAFRLWLSPPSRRPPMSVSLPDPLARVNRPVAPPKSRRSASPASTPSNRSSMRLPPSSQSPAPLLPANRPVTPSLPARSDHSAPSASAPSNRSSTPRLPTSSPSASLRHRPASSQSAGFRSLASPRGPGASSPQSPSSGLRASSTPRPHDTLPDDGDIVMSDRDSTSISDAPDDPDSIPNHQLPAVDEVADGDPEADTQLSHGDDGLVTVKEFEDLLADAMAQQRWIVELQRVLWGFNPWPCAGYWTTRTRRQQDLVVWDSTRVLQSTPGVVLDHIIAKDLPDAVADDQARGGGTELIGWLKRTTAQARHQLGIYLLYLVDQDNRSLSLETFEQLLDDLEKYVQGTNATHWATDVDQHHSLVNWTREMTRNGHRRHLCKQPFVAGEPENSPGRRERVLLFISKGRDRLVEARREQELHPERVIRISLSYCGYSGDTTARIYQHLAQKSSNFLLELCLTLLDMRSAGGEKYHDVVAYPIHLLKEVHDAFLAEVIFTRLSQSYIHNGGGFCHWPAGQNNSSVYRPEKLAAIHNRKQWAVNDRYTLSLLVQAREDHDVEEP